MQSIEQPTHYTVTSSSLIDILLVYNKDHLILSGVGDPFLNQDIDTSAKNITAKVLGIANECIPNRNITVNPSDPPWITTGLKRYIRKRKRAYHRAKETKTDTDWHKFKKLRNKTVRLVRNAKQILIKNLRIN